MQTDNLLRYQSIIEDWESFAAIISKPLPPVVRANTLKTTAEDLHRRFEDAGIPHTRCPWNGDLFQLVEPPGRRIEHWLGLYYVQEAVQTLPVLALDPQPGHTALDLCAAPGGKTTYMAARMRNLGTLVANEPNGRRQMSLLANLNRLGVLNAMVTAYQGENFPMQTSFDRVLVDAPCSAEGTLRKEPSLQQGASKAMIERLARLQKRLVVRAFDVLAPKGVLVYSTCTFAPEENEAVVAHLLSERDAQVVPTHLPIDVSPGLSAWRGRCFAQDMQHCLRTYPHQLNSGGGFLARITRA